MSKIKGEIDTSPLQKLKVILIECELFFQKNFHLNTSHLCLQKLI